jgi:hypothetical protein
MAGLHDLDLHFDSALHHRIEVIHFEPELHTIAVRSIGRIANAAVVMFVALGQVICGLPSNRAPPGIGYAGQPGAPTCNHDMGTRLYWC